MRRAETSDARLRVAELRRFRLPKPVYDPFVGDTNEMTLWEWFKLFVFGIVLVPLRLILLGLAFAIPIAWMSIVGLGHNLKYDGEEHVPKHVLRRGNVAARLCGWAVPIAVGYWHIPIKGTPANPKVFACAVVQECGRDVCMCV